MDFNKHSFPYEIRKIDNDECEELKQFHAGIFTFTDFALIGLKQYFFPIGVSEDLPNYYNMSVRPSDIFVVTFPKSGTTWTQELVWLLENNLDYEKAKSMLTDRYVFLEVPSIIKTLKIKPESGINPELPDIIMPPNVDKVAQMPSPRFFKSHLPLSLLPPNLLDTTKVVYVARDPRDVAVSYFHHNKLYKFISKDAEFKPFWNNFIKNRLTWAPALSHIIEAWDKRHHPNMLFLFYEELIKDLPGAIKRVALFLEKNITEEQVETLAEHLKFENFKNNKYVNQDELRSTGLLTENELFMRKGKAGGWREYFDDEMRQQAEDWIADGLRHTDLRFPKLK